MGSASNRKEYVPSQWEERGLIFCIPNLLSTCQGSKAFPSGTPPWGAFSLRGLIALPYTGGIFQACELLFEVLIYDFKLMSFMVKIYRLFSASPFDFSSAVSSYLTEAALICQKKWRQIEGGTPCLCTPENEQGLDRGLTAGCSHQSQSMLSHMRQLSLLKKPSDVTGPGSLHPSMSISSVQCPHLNPVTATGPFLDTAAAHEDQLSLTCELHNRASLQYSPPEASFPNSQAKDKAGTFPA